jgi:hypothetical protein
MSASNPIVRYFDLFSDLRSKRKLDEAAAKESLEYWRETAVRTKLPSKAGSLARTNLKLAVKPKPAAVEKKKLPSVIPQYIALVIGILIQPFFAAFQTNGTWIFTGILGRLLFGVIAGILILPSVYKTSFDPEKPIFIQYCVLFTAGMGWEGLLNAAITAAGKI